MIWSVSTLARGSGTTRPSCWRMGCISVLELPGAHIDEVPTDGGGGSHRRADQVSAPAATLAALEVAVTGGCAALAGLQGVGVHAQAHGAAGLPPFEAGRAENAIQPFFLRGGLDLPRTGHDHGAHRGSNLVTLRHARRGAQVLDARIGAGAD